MDRADLIPSIGIHSVPIAMADQQFAFGAANDDDESQFPASILDAAKVRWLNAEEIIELLCGEHVGQEIELLALARPSCPPQSGSLILYDRMATRDYKVDGHEWVRKKSNPKKIREDHVKLRYNGSERIRGNYVHSSRIKTFHRRAYALIDTDEDRKSSRSSSSDGEKNSTGRPRQDLVLVHYLDTEEAMKISREKESDDGASTSGRGQKRTRSMNSSDGQFVDAFGQFVDAFAAASPIPAPREGRGRVRTANSHARVLEQMSAAGVSVDRDGDDTMAFDSG